MKNNKFKIYDYPTHIINSDTLSKNNIINARYKALFTKAINDGVINFYKDQISCSAGSFNSFRVVLLATTYNNKTIYVSPIGTVNATEFELPELQDFFIAH